MAVGVSGGTTKVSVGMPVYNGELYLEEAIQCILRQTYEDFLLFISDNASTDRTEQICRDYASQDRRIVYARNATNIGAAMNFNRVFQMASGPYFRWFNADDLCAPTLHEQCVSVLDANPAAVLCYGKTNIVDGNGKLIEEYEDRLDLQQDTAEERFKRFLDVGAMTNVIYGLMRTSAVARTSLMGNGSYPAADTVFMAAMALQGKFVEIPERLFSRRMHQGATSWDRKDADAQQIFWTGKSAEYVLPIWKTYFAYLKAIRTVPLGKREKSRLTRYMLRQMISVRDYLLRDLWTWVRNMLQGRRR